MQNHFLSAADCIRDVNVQNLKPFISKYICIIYFIQYYYVLIESSSFGIICEETSRKIKIFVWQTSHARTHREVNDLIRDARARLRYEADLSFSGEAEREVDAAPGNTLRLPIRDPRRTDILAYVLGEVTFELVMRESFNSIVLRVDI